MTRGRTFGDNKAPHNWRKQEGAVMGYDAMSAANYIKTKLEHDKALARVRLDKHLQTVAPGNNRAARRAQKAELRKIAKEVARKVERHGS